MRVKLAGALIATLLVFGMVFGVGQAAAASLPGSPLYGLKLTAEQARLELTRDPEAKAELAAELAGNRLGEIAQMMASGEAVDGEVAFKAQEQLMEAYHAMHQVSGDGQLKAQERLTNMVQNQHRRMVSAVDASSQQQEPVRALIRSMVRVRAELQTGEGTAVETGDRQYPEVSEPAGQSGAAGMQAGQQDGDGLVDGSGAQTGQGAGSSYGYGSENPGAGSPYEGVAPEYERPGPAESQQGTDGPAGPWGWLLRLFQGEATQSGSGAPGTGPSNSGTSGTDSSGTSSSGTSPSDNSSTGNGTPGGKR